MPKQPREFTTMQAMITLFCLVDFTVAMFGASFFGERWKEPNAQYVQTIINIVLIVVAYYLGSSNSSKTKDAQAAVVQDKMVDALTPPASTDPNVTVMKPTK